MEDANEVSAKLCRCFAVKRAKKKKERKSSERNHENLLQPTYNATSHIGRSCRKSSKISQCWIWTGITDSAHI